MDDPRIDGAHGGYREVQERLLSAPSRGLGTGLVVATSGLATRSGDAGFPAFRPLHGEAISGYASVFRNEVQLPIDLLVRCCEDLHTTADWLECGGVDDLEPALGWIPVGSANAVAGFACGDAAEPEDLGSHLL